MRELIVIRTHFYCEATDRFYSYLRRTANRDIAFVCDETNGPVDIGPGKVKLSMSESSAREMGLHVPRRFGWLCGDYCLYTAAQLLGGYDRYWLIESDVRMSMPSSADFFDQFSDNPADLLAFHIFRAHGKWFWYKPMAYFTDQVHACLFPVVGVRKRAIQFALHARQQMSRTFEDIVPKDEARRWPNDESFLMSTLMTNGFTCQSIDNAGVRFRTQDSFHVGVPLSDRRIAGQEPTGLLYHPVQSRQRFVSKANNQLSTFSHQKSTRQRITEVFNDVFLEDLRLEASADEIIAFERRLGEVLRNAPA